MDAKDLLIDKQAGEIRTLKDTIKRLEERIAQLEKDSGNSSKPPSSDIVKPKKTVRKVSRVRSANAAGSLAIESFTRKPALSPEQVDEVIEYELKDKDAVRS